MTEDALIVPDDTGGTDTGDWLLYTCDSPSTSSGRGLARGMIYDRAGNLVASTAQEGVIRLRREKT